MFKSETEFRDAILKVIRSKGFVAYPVEAPGTLGIPDAWFVRNKDTNGWIEFKLTKGKRGRHSKVPFRPGQYKWLHEAYKHGANVYLFWAFDDGMFLFKNEQISLSLSEYSFRDAWFACCELTHDSEASLAEALTA